VRALIDSDIFCYEIGCATQEDKKTPLEWPLVQWRVDQRIDQILEVTSAESWQGYLTGKGNFRDEAATIRPYKGHRDRSDRPYWYSGVYNYLRDSRNVTVVDGMEADDQLAIEHTGSDGNTIVCSRDKDLRQVPGWHYTWPSWKQEESKPYYISELDGLRFFYSQLLTGDRADNIPGLHGVGAKSATVSRVNEATTELEMFQEVQTQYELRFGSYWDMFMAENGALLWLLRHPKDDWYSRQKELTSCI
jgi:hypothetical protein